MQHRPELQNENQTELEALKSLAEATPSLVWIADPQGSLVYANEQFCNYAGRPVEPSLGSGWLELCHPDELALIKQGWQLKIKQANPFETEFRYRRGDGLYRWHHVSVLPVRDKTGRIYAWFGTNTDVQEQRTRRDRMFRAVFDNTFQFIGLLGLDGKILEANRAALDFAGVKLQDVKGKYFWETPWWSHSEAEQARVKESVNRAAAGSFERFEARHVSPTGKTIFVDFSLKPIFDEHGKVVMLIPEGRDITDQVLVQERLKASERHYRRIFENASDLIVSMTLDGAIIYANPSWHTSLEFESRDVQLFNFFDMIVPGDRPAAEAAFKLIKEGAVYEQIETTLLARSGRLIEVEGNLSRDYYEDLRLVLAIFRNVSARKEMERRVSEFYSNVSHELRTPLTSIRASLGLIEGGLAGDISSKASELVHIARIESDRMIRMINDILDIKKVESGKLELKRCQLKASDVVQETVRNVQGMADEFGIAMAVQIETEQLIEGDHDRLVQVLMNLVSNAVKFSPSTGNVAIKVEESGGMVRFAVEDKGPGISSDDVGKLFEMFQQLSMPVSPKRQGSGLGLAISKSLVELHGGRIGVNTKLGEGSCFWFELPVCESQGSGRQS
jgi:PAS domain S-box-containing protein